MNKRLWPIEQTELLYGRVVKIDNQNLTPIRNIFYTASSPSGLCDTDWRGVSLAIDALYDTNNYFYIENIKNYYKIMEEIGHRNFYVNQDIYLEPLLKYFGFPTYLGLKDIEAIKNNLFNGTFARENYDLFGYSRCCPEEYQWRNGKMHHKETGKKMTTNGQDCYLLTNPDNELATYFPVLYNSSLKDFLPKEEEGPIRKRIA